MSQSPPQPKKPPDLKLYPGSLADQLERYYREHRPKAYQRMLDSGELKGFLERKQEWGRSIRDEMTDADAEEFQISEVIRDTLFPPSEEEEAEFLADQQPDPADPDTWPREDTPEEEARQTRVFQEFIRSEEAARNPAPSPAQPQAPSPPLSPPENPPTATT